MGQKPTSHPSSKISTGQFRRTPIEWLIDQAIEQIQTEGTGVVSVAYLDIDGFSRIEEKHGYMLADALLDAVASYLRKLDNVSFAERYVRDSFLIVYKNLPLEQAFLAAEQVRSQLSQTIFTVTPQGSSEQQKREPAEIIVSFSAGVATYPGEPEGRHELIGLAEGAARRAWESGGGCTHFGRSVNMTPKTSHYSPTQLERLRELRNRLGRSEASLLREALDDLLRKYDQRDIRRGWGLVLGWMNPGRKNK